MSQADLTGRRFGNLTAHWPVGFKAGHVCWLCHCDCGNLHFARASVLIGSRSRSCGCRTREMSSLKNTTHGRSKTPGYESWKSMFRRCCDPNSKAFGNYGGRGITICERWQGEKGIENFLADMGPRPSPQHSIDRFPNNDGNYEPGNCRWATRKEQVNNRRLKRIENFSNDELLRECKRRGLIVETMKTN
jgi:hypothetical protein